VSGMNKKTYQTKLASLKKKNLFLWIGKLCAYVKVRSMAKRQLSQSDLELEVASEIRRSIVKVTLSYHCISPCDNDIKAM
jgi:hypothetical protein